MTKVLDYIHIKNMYAHKDRRIDFSEGKNYIVGNFGSGKSVVLESIAFAFFGTVALRGKAPTYKGLYVELSFNHLGESFIIKRKINDASLLLLDPVDKVYKEIANSTSIVNQKIISLLGYNYDIYLLSNYCKQGKLTYFSELTPAKRLQYIDKISGIEDSKELVDWLLKKRKSLKENLNLIKDMVKKPILDSDVSLEINYELEIEKLSDKLSSLNSMYELFNTHFEKSIVKERKPTIDLNDFEKALIGVTEDQLKLFENYIDSLDSVNSELNILDNKIRDIPNINKNLSKYTLEEVDDIINQYNISLIDESFFITCSECKSELHLKSLLNDHSLPLETFNIKDLYNYKDYLLNDLTAIKRDLEANRKNLELNYQNLIDNSPLPFLYKYNKNQLITSFKIAQNGYSKYKQDLIEYGKILTEAKQSELLANKIKEDIDLFLAEQASLLQLKDKYIKDNLKKSIYLSTLDIYNTTIDKYNEITIQLNTINALLKDITIETNKIKQQTIPLINHHASKYLNMMTKGVMAKIEITESYDLIVDNFEINLKSGAQQDLSSLAFRLSLSQSIITGMLPLFIGDEIDSSAGDDVSNDITNALTNISNKGFQIILITHKDISNIENSNIIQL